MKTKISKLSIYDINVYSSIERIDQIVKKTNEVVDLVNDMKDNEVVMQFDCFTGNLTICPRNRIKSECDHDLKPTWGCEY